MLKSAFGILFRAGRHALSWVQRRVAVLALLVFIAGTAGTFGHLYR